MLFIVYTKYTERSSSTKWTEQCTGCTFESQELTLSSLRQVV
jgi:hypothetical protein